jgi:hypothetical protein
LRDVPVFEIRTPEGRRLAIEIADQQPAQFAKAQTGQQSRLHERPEC